jgi:hypothetical protein
MRRSRQFVATAQSLRTAAAAAHEKASRIVRQAFACHIRGGSSEDLREQVIKRKLSNPFGT